MSMARSKRKKARRGLTPKESRFVDEFLFDLNATQAAIRAGFSEKSARQLGYRLLKKVHIQEAVNKAIAARSERAKMDADEVLREFARVGRSDILSYVSFGPDGIALRSSTELTEDQAKALAEVSETINAQGVRQFRFKLHDKNRALENLAKHLGLLVDRLEHTGKGGGPVEASLTVHFVDAPSKPDE